MNPTSIMETRPLYQEVEESSEEFEEISVTFEDVTLVRGRLGFGVQGLGFMGTQGESWIDKGLSTAVPVFFCKVPVRFVPWVVWRFQDVGCVQF